VKDKDNAGGVLAGSELLDEQFTKTAMMAGLNQGYPVVHIASHFALGPDYASSYLLLGDGAHLSLAQINSGGQVFQDVDLLTLSACDTAVGGRSGDGHEVESFGMLAQDKGAAAILASLWPVSDASTQLLMRQFYLGHQTQSGISKAEALRQAQLSLLHGTASASETNPGKRAGRAVEDTGDENSHQPLFKTDPKAPYAHPYYWAPFVLIGNWR
nr:CHAT domain-containing protein [Armatimonadota bacterium]